LVPSSWAPWGIAGWPGRSGCIFYGQNPSDQVQGFYYHRVGASESAGDSLIYAIGLTRFSARGMSIRNDGGCLYFSEGNGHCTFYQLDLDRGSATPRVIAERSGGSGQIIPHPLRADLVLLEYTFAGDATNPPQSHIELLDTSARVGRDLDVRTSPYNYTFIVNDHPWWSPDGDHFAFSAGHFSGESPGGSPLTLWVYRDVP